MQSKLQENVAYGNEKTVVVKKISWASIWAGALIGIVVLMLLNLLGLGVGFSSLDIQEERNPASGLGIGSGIWYIISSLIALFVAGWVSGRLAQTSRIFDGALHGILTWCIITLASLYFLTTTIGSIIGGAGSLVSSTLGSVSQGSGKILELAGPEIKNQLENMDFSEMKNSGTAEQAIELLKKADGDPAKVNRNELATIIMTQTGKTREEATMAADTLVTNYKDAVVKFKVKDSLKHKIPHIGWSQISIAKESVLMKGIPDLSEFYFVHSYYVTNGNPDHILNETEFENKFTSAIQKENIFGVQYHPEKSHDTGALLLKNFINL